MRPPPAGTNQSVVTAYQSDVRVPVDPSTGAATGKRQFSAVTFTKPVSASSVQLFQALLSSEVLTNVTFEFVTVGSDGVQHPFQRVQLSNAIVSDIKQHSGASKGSWLEDVSLVFQSITVTNIPTSIVAQATPSGI